MEPVAVTAVRARGSDWYASSRLSVCEIIVASRRSRWYALFGFGSLFLAMTGEDNAAVQLVGHLGTKDRLTLPESPDDN